VETPSIEAVAEAQSASEETQSIPAEAEEGDATAVYVPGAVRMAPAAAPKSDATPWFLRVETPKAARHPLAEHEKLPDLPPNPPSELSEMLQQLSEEHGISNLKLLDLRGINPPPAIGNVVMILGNARSIRHLHATADKVCRFMRSQYKWSPYADGLLGRNELRLINRRKQRRGKVVSAEMGEVDEAGSAGWVCVNGGGQSLVVQLFTKAKREEMDIEGLWVPEIERAERHRIAEARRKAERERKWAEENEARSKVPQEDQAIVQEEVKAVASEGQAVPQPEEQAIQEVSTARKERVAVVQEAVKAVAPEAAAPVSLAQKEGQTVVPAVAQEEPRVALEEGAVQQKEKAWDAADRIQPIHTQSSVSGPMVQTRSLHELTTSASEGAAAASLDVTAHSSFPKFIRTGDLSDFLSTLSSISPSAETPQSELILQAHINALQSPFVEPAPFLGKGFSDKSSTPFLRTFYATLASATPEAQVKYTLSLLLLANTHSEQYYPIRSFLSVLQDLRFRGLPVQTEHYYLILHHLATCSELRPSVEYGWQDVADERAALISTYLDDLKQHLSPEDAQGIEDRPEFKYTTFLALMKAPVWKSRQALLEHSWKPETPLDLGLPASMGKFTFHPRIFSGKGLGSLSSDVSPFRYTLREHHLDYLTALGLTGKFEAMWEFWKRLPLHGVTRSAEYYKIVFGTVVLGGRQDVAVYAVRMMGLQSMDREMPRVSFLEMGLARAFLRVMDIADESGNGGEYKLARSICRDIAEKGY
jgi:hypothetical protein